MKLDYDVVTTTATDDRDWYGVQVKGFGGNNAGLGFSSYQPAYGFISRPLDATVDADGIPTGCTAFTLSVGRSGDFAWYGHDPRYSDKCPPASKGSAGVWTAKGQYLLFDYDTDTLTIRVPATGGGTYEITVGSDGGQQSIALKHASGTTSVIMTATQVTVASPTVHVNSANVLLGTSPGRQVACVGDLVSVVVPQLLCTAPGSPAVPVPPTLLTLTGGTQAIGQIISGVTGVSAGP